MVRYKKVALLPPSESQVFPDFFGQINCRDELPSDRGSLDLKGLYQLDLESLLTMNPSIAAELFEKAKKETEVKERQAFDSLIQPPPIRGRPENRFYFKSESDVSKLTRISTEPLKRFEMLFQEANCQASCDYFTCKDQNLQSHANLLRSTPHGEVQAMIVFKVWFAEPISRELVQQLDLETLNRLLACVLSPAMLPGPVYSYPRAVELLKIESYIIRPHQNLCFQIKNLLERFMYRRLRSLIETNPVTIEWVYKEFFVAGFTEQKFRRYFDCHPIILDYHKPTLREGSQSFDVLVAIKTVDTELIERLRACQRFVTEFRGYAEGELELEVRNQIKEEVFRFFKRMLRFIKARQSNKLDRFFDDFQRNMVFMNPPWKMVELRSAVAAVLKALSAPPSVASTTKDRPINLV